MRTAVLVLLVPALAAAEPIASPLEAGTLDRGQLGFKAGVGLAPGMFGLGAQGWIGLRGIDVIASGSAIPSICKSCGDGILFAGLGVQARLVRAGRFHVGARVDALQSFAGDDVHLATGAVVATAGSAHVRVSIAPMVLHYSESSNPFEENGWYMGGTLGIAYISDFGGGLEVTGGAAGQLRYDNPHVMPLVSLAFFVRS